MRDYRHTLHDYSKKILIFTLSGAIQIRQTVLEASMRSIRASGVCGAVAIAMALAVAAISYADASGSITGYGDSRLAAFSAPSTPVAATSASMLAQREVFPGQANVADQVQGEITRAELVPEIEVALGDDFAGVWYESSIPRLYVGVTSGKSRRRVEGIAAEAGLAGNVGEVSVSSTWDQLVAGQRRLNQRLADLFASEEVATAIAPQHNSVEVELGSGVAFEERLALEREVSDAEVDVSVSIAAHPKIQIKRQARCKKFEAGKAYCDPTIVAGVTIHNATKVECTAGPAVRQEATSQEDTTPTYLLTAGHCISGLGEKWYAYDKSGAKIEIGPAHEFLTSKADVGVILIDKTSKWRNVGYTPVNPAIARWTAKEDSEPSVVPGQVKPVIGNKTCISAQTSGEKCGTIKKLAVKVGADEELVEVTGTTTAGGDSGAPWFSIEAASNGLVEGTHVGLLSGNPIFSPLEFSFSQLKTKLELLTQGNEERASCPMEGMCCL